MNFKVPASCIPLIYIPITPNTVGNNNLTEYQVMVSYQGNNFATPLIWIPQTSAIPQITAVNGALFTQPIDDPYYYDFSYQNVVDMVNNALEVIFTAHSTALPTVAYIPYMSYSAQTGLFSLTGTASLNTDEDPTNANNTMIYFNAPLSSIFSGFEYYQNTISGQVWKGILIRNTKNNIIESTTEYPARSYIMTAEFFGDDAMESLERIVFTSGSIPVRTEAEGGTGSGVSSNVLGIVKDFIPATSTANGQYRSSFINYVQSEFIRSDLVGDQPLSSVQLGVHWADSLGVIRHILIDPNNQLTIKVLFERINKTTR
jgi:hypothetical protein